MKKFVFELQTLQDIKEKEENLEKKHMHTIEERIKELNRELEILLKEMDRVRMAMIEKMGGLVKAEDLNNYHNYIKKLKNDEKKQKEKIGYELRRKAASVNKLIELNKELKSLEKLKDKKYEEYLQEAKKEEEKIIDDIISFNIAAS